MWWVLLFCGGSLALAESPLQLSHVEYGTSHRLSAPTDTSEVFGRLDGEICTISPIGIRCGDEVLWQASQEPLDWVISDDAAAILTDDGWLEVGLGDSGAVEEMIGLPYVSGDGSLAWRGDGAADAGPLDVFQHLDGSFAEIDVDGHLRLTNGAGAVVADIAGAELGLDGWLQAEPLGDEGWVFLDEEGLAAYSTDGELLWESDLPGRSIGIVGEDVWVASASGLIVMDQNGAQELIDPRGCLDADYLDGEWMMLDEDRNVWHWEDAQRSSHRSAIVSMSEGPGTTLVSIDAQGRSFVWSQPTTAIPLGLNDRSAAHAEDGVRWVLSEDSWRRRAMTGEESTGGGGGSQIIAVGDGVLILSNAILSRISSEGETRWSTELPFAGTIRLWGDVLVLEGGDRSAVIDAESGVRRRLLESQPSRLTVGVAVGGLIELRNHGDMRGTRPGVEPADAGIAVGNLKMAHWGPSGLWYAALDSGGQLRIVDGVSGGVLAEGKRPARAVRSMRVSDAWVWLGREDGVIERWSLAGVDVDRSMPSFSSYAQLEPFVAPPDWGQTRMLKLSHDGDVSLAPGPQDEVIAVRGPRTILRAGASPMVIADKRGLTFKLVTSSPGGPVWLASADHTLWMVREDGRLRRAFKADGDVQSICSVGDRVYVLTDRKIHSFDAESGRRSVRSVAAKFLACGPEDSAWVADEEGAWPIGSSTSAAKYRHPGGLTALSVLSNGSVVTGGRDETVILWDGESKAPLYVLEGHEGPIRGMVSDVAGRRLVASTVRNRIVMWDLTRLIADGRLQFDGAVRAMALSSDGVQLTVALPGRGVHQLILPALDDPADEEDSRDSSFGSGSPTDPVPEGAGRILRPR